jgi:hypothetical protein
VRYRNKFLKPVLDHKYGVVFNDKDLDYVYIAKKLIRCNVCSNRFSQHYKEGRIVKTLFYSVKFMTPVCSEECHAKLWEDYHKIKEQQESQQVDISPLRNLGRPSWSVWP